MIQPGRDSSIGIVQGNYEEQTYVLFELGSSLSTRTGYGYEAGSWP